MKMTQAWGWLMAGVLAAGMNASYHDGGLQWVHRAAENIEHNSAAVLALASGHADQFLTEARLLTARNRTASCQLATTLARMQTRVTQLRAARSDNELAHFEVMSAREEEQLAKLEANRARMVAQVARIQIAPVAFNPAVFKSVVVLPACPRVRVNLPRLPRIKTPTLPVIHVETMGAGPV